MRLLITSFYSESVAAENFSEENQMEPLRLPMPIYCDRVSINPRLKLCQAPKYTAEGEAANTQDEIRELSAPHTTEEAYECLSQEI